MGKIVRGKTICDNFEHEFKINKYENMFSDRDILYPKRARLLLSILIDRAKKGLPPIGTAEVAKELEIPGHSIPERSFPRIQVGQCCACIATTLYQWEQVQNEKLPRLTNIVISKPDFKPGNFIFDGLEEKLGCLPTWKDYKDKLLAPIHAYEKWDEVLNTIELVNKNR